MKLLFSRKGKAAIAERPARDVLRLLTGYVLHMSITSLGDGDITPLYEEYVNDPRLGTFERRELTEAFRALRLRHAFASPGG